MDMMNELLRLRDAGKLSGPTAYWFRLTKREEEFYDCDSDPLNLNNLVDDPEYAGKISELRMALEKHIQGINDKAEIPEAEMIEQAKAFHKTIAVLAATILIIASPQIFAQPTGCPMGMAVSPFWPPALSLPMPWPRR